MTNWYAAGPGGRSIAIDPTNTQTVYVGGAHVAKSIYGGFIWNDASTGLPDTLSPNVSSLVIDPSNPQTIYAAINQLDSFGFPPLTSGVFKSNNGGTSWGDASTGLTADYLWIYSLAIDPTDPKTVYVATDGDGVYMSNNGGTNWSAANTGLTNTHIRSLAIDPSDPRIVYAGTYGGGVFKTVLPPVNGTCGVSNGLSFAAAPTTNLCSSGTASAVTGAGPWNWSCSGSDGGTDASCSANAIQSTVTPTTGSGHTITPATPQGVNINATTSFTVSAASGFGIASVTGCNGSLNGNSYTTGPITANCSISVSAVARNARNGSTAAPTIIDALKVLRVVVGISTLNETERISYDVAPLSSSGTPVGDGVIDIGDVVLVLRRSIGIGDW
jgi:hypothetical protein